MIETLLALQIGVALLALLYRNLLVSVILLAVFSLLNALLFFLLHAPDVALTEAAVGAGVSTFILVWAVKR